MHGMKFTMYVQFWQKIILTILEFIKYCLNKHNYLSGKVFQGNQLYLMSFSAKTNTIVIYYYSNILTDRSP